MWRLRRAEGGSAALAVEVAPVADHGEHREDEADRQAAYAGTPADPAVAAYVATVRQHAYRVTDDHVAALFADGLTTRDEVSELSGRGVGLAAARRAVTDVGGEVTVTSSDRGTAFRFTLPITAATARVRAA